MSDEFVGNLLERIAKQDRQAFDELYRLLSGKIYGYLRLRLSNESGIEDVLQDTFLAIWRQSSSFQRASKATTWVFGIARHKLLDWLRATDRLEKVRGVTVAESTLSEAKWIDSGTKDGRWPLKTQLDSETGVQEDFAPHLITKLSINQALRTLTPESRELLYLVFVERWPYRDIARLLGIPEGTIKSRVHHLKRQLAVLLLEEVMDCE